MSDTTARDDAPTTREELRERDRRTRRDGEAQARDAARAALEERCQELTAKVAYLESSIRLRDTLLGERDALLREREALAAEGGSLMREQGERLTAALREQDRLVEALAAAEQRADQVVAEMTGTMSWRVTAPLRRARSLAGRVRR